MLRRRWRDYQTARGARPVRDFLRSLSDEDYADVRAAMVDIAERGLQAARHLRGDIYEVRSSGDRVAYRVLFAAEGARSQVLLALEAFKKKTQKTPPATIALAERGRVRDAPLTLYRWRYRMAPCPDDPTFSMSSTPSGPPPTPTSRASWPRRASAGR